MQLKALVLTPTEPAPELPPKGTNSAASSAVLSTYAPMMESTPMTASSGVASYARASATNEQSSYATTVTADSVRYDVASSSVTADPELAAAQHGDAVSAAAAGTGCAY